MSPLSTGRIKLYKDNQFNTWVVMWKPSDRSLGSAELHNFEDALLVCRNVLKAFREKFA